MTPGGLVIGVTIRLRSQGFGWLSREVREVGIGVAYGPLNSTNLCGSHTG